MNSRSRFVIITASDAGMYHHVDLALALKQRGHCLDVLVINDHPSCTWAYTQAGLKWRKYSWEISNTANYDLALCHCPEMYIRPLERKKIPICTLLVSQDPHFRGNCADAYADCDLLLVGGSNLAKELRRAGARRELIVTGLPRYDRLVSWPQQEHKLILFTDTDAHPSLPEERKDLAEQLTAIARKHPNHLVIIKSRHPRKNSYYAHFHAQHLTYILEESKDLPSNLLVIEENRAKDAAQRLQELIPGWKCPFDLPDHLSSLELLVACCSVLITYPSSCTLPALALGKPLLILESMFNQDPPPGEPFGFKGLTRYYHESGCVIPQERLLDYLPQGLRCKEQFRARELHKIDGQATARIISILETLAREWKSKGAFLPPLGLETAHWQRQLQAYFRQYEQSSSRERYSLFLAQQQARALTILLSKLNYQSNVFTQTYTLPAMEPLFSSSLQALQQALENTPCQQEPYKQNSPLLFLAREIPGLAKKMWSVLGQPAENYFPKAAAWLWAWYIPELQRQGLLTENTFSAWLKTWHKIDPSWTHLCFLFTSWANLPRDLQSAMELLEHNPGPKWTETLFQAAKLRLLAQQTQDKDLIENTFYQTYNGLTSRIDQIFFLKLWTDLHPGKGAKVIKRFMTACLYYQLIPALAAFLEIGDSPLHFFHLEAAKAQKKINQILSALTRAEDEDRKQLAQVYSYLGFNDLAMKTLKGVLQEHQLSNGPENKQFQASVIFDLAQLHLKQGQPSQACQAIQRCLLLDPGHEQARSLLVKRPTLFSSIGQNTGYVCQTREEASLEQCKQFLDKELPGQKVIIYGSGELGIRMARLCQKMDLMGFMDTYLSQWQNKVLELPLYGPEQLPGLDPDLVLIASMSHGQEIEQTIRSYLPQARTFVPSPGTRDNAPGRRVEKIICQINLFIRDKPQTILFCTRSMNHNQIRFLSALKKRGWGIIVSCPTTLVCGATPFSELPPFYDLLFHPASLSEQLEIISQVRPAIVHYLAYMFHLSEAALAKMACAGPFVLECCDLTSTAFDQDSLARLKGRQWAEEEFWAEEFLFKNIEGIVFQDSPQSIECLCERYDVTGLKGLHFQSYPLQEWLQPPREKSTPPPWRLVYAGGIHSNQDRTNDGYFLTRSLLELIPAITSQNIQFDIYNAYDRTGQGYEEFIALAREDPLFNYFPALANHNLAPVLSTYDWGWYVLDFKKTVVKKQFYQECFGSKFWAYVEAGLPILISPEHTYMAGLAKDLGIGLPFAASQIGDLRQVLDQADRDRFCSQLDLIQQEYIMEKQIKRLEDFYLNLINRQ